MVQYPTGISSDVLDTLINMIRTKALDKANLALAIWNVQGYVQSILITEPKIYGAVNDNPSDEEALTILEQLKNNQAPETNQTKSGQQIVGLGPVGAWGLRLLLQWLINKLVTEI